MSFIKKTVPIATTLRCFTKEVPDTRLHLFCESPYATFFGSSHSEDSDLRVLAKGQIQLDGAKQLGSNLPPGQDERGCQDGDRYNGSKLAWGDPLPPCQSNPLTAKSSSVIWGPDFDLWKVLNICKGGVRGSPQYKV